MADRLTYKHCGWREDEHKETNLSEEILELRQGYRYLLRDCPGSALSRRNQEIAERLEKGKVTFIPKPVSQYETLLARQQIFL